MTDEKDWRLNGQEKFLTGVQFQKKQYQAPSPKWDHAHCEFCWAKFMETEGKDILLEGYVSQDGENWICSQCFSDFQESFQFKVI